MAACTSCMSSVEAASPGVRGEAGEAPRRPRCRRSTSLLLRPRGVCGTGWVRIGLPATTRLELAADRDLRGDLAFGSGARGARAARA